MNAQAFMRYLAERTQAEQPAWLPHDDPSVEMYDGAVRIFDQRGESCNLRSPLPRQLRALAFQLSLCADEIERRGFER